MLKRHIVHVVVLAGLLGASPARAQAPDITHDAVGCLVAGKYPRLRACFSSPVAKARVFFRREDRPIWYHVAMTPDAQCFEGVLPRPTRELIGKKVPYYVEVASQSLDVGRTQEHEPVVVRTEMECKAQAVAPYLSKATVKVLPEMPPGFSAGGLGGGLVAGGAVVVGIGAGVLAGGNNGSDTRPPLPAPGPATPTPVPTATPTPGPAPIPTPTPGTNGPPNGVFVVNPDPPLGSSPMAVRFNLCRSTDPDNDTLVFRFEFGDGQTARGSCREDHVYEAPTNGEAVYTATACVTDGRPGNEQCRTYQVRVQGAPPGNVGVGVSLTGTGAGTVAGTGGINCPGTCTASVLSGTSVTLAASPAAGSSFQGWSGASCGTSPTCTFTPTADVTVTARFDLIGPSPVTVTLGGTGTGTVTGPNIACPGDCSESYSYGTQVTLTANPAAPSTFAGWSGVASCGAARACTFTVTGPVPVTANFAPPVMRQLTVAVSPAGGGTVTGPGIACPGDCTESYVDGTVVTLNATPTGTGTVSWNPASCATGSACTVTMNADQTVTATFTPTFPLTVTFSGDGNVQGSWPGGGINCFTTCTVNVPAGTAVSMTATAAANWTFDTWSGQGCGRAAICAFTMPASTTGVGVTFLPPPGRRITLLMPGSGSCQSDVQPGIVCPGACSYPDFADGSTVVLTCDRDMTWTGCPNATPRTCTLVMTQDWQVTADAPIPPPRATSLSWLSDLKVPKGRGQVIVNQRAWEVGTGPQRAALDTPSGEGRVEATLTQAVGAGSWRFELPTAVEPGSLRVVEGKVEALTGNAVVFRLSGKPGERVSFVFTLAR